MKQPKALTLLDVHSFSPFILALSVCNRCFILKRRLLLFLRFDKL